jgi:hypothetical protein
MWDGHGGPSFVVDFVHAHGDDEPGRGGDRGNDAEGGAQPEQVGARLGRLTCVEAGLPVEVCVAV